MLKMERRRKERVRERARKSEGRKVADITRKCQLDHHKHCGNQLFLRNQLSDLRVKEKERKRKREREREQHHDGDRSRLEQ